jgi:hypothetical protein
VGRGSCRNEAKDGKEYVCGHYDQGRPHVHDVTHFTTHGRELKAFVMLTPNMKLSAHLKGIEESMAKMRDELTLNS